MRGDETMMGNDLGGGGVVTRAQRELGRGAHGK